YRDPGDGAATTASSKKDRHRDRDQRVDPSDYLRGPEAHVLKTEEPELEHEPRNREVRSDGHGIPERGECLATEQPRQMVDEGSERSQAHVPEGEQRDERPSDASRDDRAPRSTRGEVE